MIVPPQLEANCRKNPVRMAWFARLPALVEELSVRWSLSVGAPITHPRVTCSWVAPAVRTDGSPAILKLAMPHMEGEHEIAGLRYWNGNPTVRLLEADDERGAMLLERCIPGVTLNEISEPEQDKMIATLAQRLRGVGAPEPALSLSKSPSPLGTWETKPQHSLFRPLSAMLDYWRAETLVQRPHWPDEGLVNEGLALFQSLSAPSDRDTLLATDLHAGNVLRAEREPWLVIDPKPFLGDPAYDLTQHLINCEQRLHQDPVGLVHRLAGLAQVDAERLRFWTFARASADPRDNWHNELWLHIARALAP